MDVASEVLTLFISQVRGDTSALVQRANQLWHQFGPGAVAYKRPADPYLMQEARAACFGKDANDYIRLNSGKTLLWLAINMPEFYGQDLFAAASRVLSVVPRTEDDVISLATLIVALARHASARAVNYLNRGALIDLASFVQRCTDAVVDVHSDMIKNAANANTLNTYVDPVKAAHEVKAIEGGWAPSDVFYAMGYEKRLLHLQMALKLASTPEIQRVFLVPDASDIRSFAESMRFAASLSAKSIERLTDKMWIDLSVRSIKRSELIDFESYKVVEALSERVSEILDMYT